MSMPIAPQAEATHSASANPRKSRSTDGDQGFAALLDNTPAPENRQRAEGKANGQANGKDHGKPHAAGSQQGNSGDGTEKATHDKQTAKTQAQASGEARADTKGAESTKGTETADPKTRKAELLAKLAASVQTEGGSKASGEPDPANAAKDGKSTNGKSGTVIHGQKVNVDILRDTPVPQPRGPLNGATAVAAADAAQKAADKTSKAAAKAVSGITTDADDADSAERTSDDARSRRRGDGPDPRAAEPTKGTRPQADAEKHQVNTPGHAKQRGGIEQLIQAGRGGETPQPRGEGTSPPPTPQAAKGSSPPPTPQAATSGQAQSQTFDPVMQQTGPGGGAGQSAGLDATAKAANAPQARPTLSQPPVNQVAVQIQQAVAAGRSHMQIRLHPAELGRIDVKLEMHDNGTVRAVLSVDKPETLDLMQRDPRALEKALQDAGLKTDGGSLSFNLREDGQGGGSQGRHAGGGHSAPSANIVDDSNEAIAQVDPSRSGLRDGRLDIRI